MSKYRQCKNSLALEWNLNLCSNVDKSNIPPIFHTIRIYTMNILLKRLRNLSVQFFHLTYFWIIITINYTLEINCSFGNLLFPFLSQGFFGQAAFSITLLLALFIPHIPSSVISSRKISLRFLTNHSFYNTSSLT